MKVHVFTLLILTGVGLAGCGGEATPDPTAAAQLAETVVAAALTAQPTNTPPLQSEPTEEPSTWTNPIDGAVYVRVPAGAYLMGSTDIDPLARDDEKPQRSVTLDEFWIMQTEVTNKHYAKCVQAGECTRPENSHWDDPEKGDHPVTDLTWFQASEYADWAGGRLPSEAEWEKACRGTDGRIYPWGDSIPTTEQLNFDDNIGDTTPVGAYSPQGDSPYGAFDMLGNVYEWTASRWEDDAERRVLRGGSFNNSGKITRCAARSSFFTNYNIVYFGLRVVTSSRSTR